jgi:chemotaxis protein methyltransferase CheR
MNSIRISEREFEKFRSLIHQVTGIHMKKEKSTLLESRLAKRLRHFGMSSYSQYYDNLQSDAIELQVFINSITTNETSFFREPHHFDFLKKEILSNASSMVRIWSAAGSIGAEAYSTGMVCDEILGVKKVGWEILCSDINIDVIDQAQSGLYPNRFIAQIPERYLKLHCLKGFGQQEGFFIVDDYLKGHLLFKRLNLMEPVSSDIGDFDVIFLRNMLIYFNTPEKKFIVENVVSRLKKGGHLIIGHSETLYNVTTCVQQVSPTIYIKL